MKATEKQKEYFKQYYLKNRDKFLKKAKEYKLKNPYKNYIEKVGYAKIAIMQRKSYLKRAYNVTLEEYEKKLKEQNYCCAICNKHRDKFKRNLSVDHDHTTNQIRGLLCIICNTNVGVVEDKLEMIQKYLNKYRKDVN